MGIPLAVGLDEVEAYPGFAVTASYLGYFLKRFEDEDEETITEPGPCRFLTEDNLCDIQPVKPTSCRKFPYMVFINGAGEYDAYYVKMKIVGDVCRGFVEREKLRRRWLIPWIKILENSVEETKETVKSGILVISDVGDAY